MYTNPAVVGTTVVAGSLAATGINLVWLPLSAFALLGAGLALLRILPRRTA